MNLFSPRGFLQVGGVVLVVVGVLGFVGILGPTPEQSIFGSLWWFDNSENVAHTVIGVVALLAVYMFPASYNKMLVMAVGVLAILVGLYNLTGEVMLLGANLQSPADLVLHLVVGAWALYASTGRRGMSK